MNGRRRASLAAAALAALLAGCVVDVDLGRSPDAAGAPDEDPVTPAPEPDPDFARDLDARPDAITADAITPDAITPDAIPPDAITPDATPDAARPPDAGVDPRDCPECAAALAARVEACALPDCGIGPAVLDLCLVDACGLPPADDCALCPARAERFMGVCRAVAAPASCERVGRIALEDCATRCAADDCLACLDVALPPDPCAGLEPTRCAVAIRDRAAACADACDGPALLACVERAGSRHRLCGGRIADCDAALEAALRACRTAGAEGACVACPPQRAAEQRSCHALGVEPAACAARDEATALACEAGCIGDVLTACDAAGRIAALSCDAAGGPACAELDGLVAAQCRANAGIAPQPCDDCATRALAGAMACVDAPEACLAAVEERWSRCLAACGVRGSQGGCLACGVDADRALGRCLVEGALPARCFNVRALAEADCLGRCGALRPDALPCALRAHLLAERCLDAEPLDPICGAAAARFDDACRWSRGE